MKIALDAMGGDRAPKATVHVAVWADRDFGLTIQLVGRPEVIEAELADVIVTDGFTGNVYLKGAEGTARLIQKILDQEIRVRPLALLGALLAHGAFRALRTKLDYREFFGGPLLGVNGVVIIAHGRSDPYTVRNAIRVARQAVENGLVQAIKSGLGEERIESDE